jgi:hypothetical protein
MRGLAASSGPNTKLEHRPGPHKPSDFPLLSPACVVPLKWRPRPHLRPDLAGLMKDRGLASLPLDPPDPAEWHLGPALGDPTSGIAWRRRSAWTLDPLAEIATLHSEWIQFDDSESIVSRIRQEAMPLKIIGRVEMEHALLAAGLRVQALFGSFDCASPSPNEKGEMIWIASPERATATVE